MHLLKAGLGLQDLLVPEGPLQIGVHLHVPELGDDEVQVGDGLRLFLGVVLQ